MCTQIYYVDIITYVLSDLITGNEWTGVQHISNDLPNSIVIILKYTIKNCVRKYTLLIYVLFDLITGNEWAGVQHISNDPIR